MANDILTELKEKLSRKNLEESTKSGKLTEAFEEIADILLNKVAIRKGDKEYWIKVIEFYLYNDEHKDISTYPRKCEAGQWFFHTSGVDISFESYVKTNDNEYGLFQPILDKESFFGGILIRQIYPAGKRPEDAPKYRLDGPHKVEWELFDQFDAFKELQKLPYLIPREYTSKKIYKYKRINLKPSRTTPQQKLRSILQDNYSLNSIPKGVWNIPEEILLDAFNKYFEAEYRYTI